DLRRQISRSGAKVLFKDRAIVVDDERVNTSYAVFRRPRNQGEPSDHRTAGNVLVRAARCVRTLFPQHAEIVTVIWFSIATLRSCRGHGKSLGDESLRGVSLIQAVFAAR